MSRTIPELRISLGACPGCGEVIWYEPDETSPEKFRKFADDIEKVLKDDKNAKRDR